MFSGADRESREVEDAFCPRESATELCFENWAPERLRLLFCVAEAARGACYDIHSPLDQPCVLYWTAQSVSFCSHLTNMKAAFPVGFPSCSDGKEPLRFLPAVQEAQV